jgi:hypothetical protein
MDLALNFLGKLGFGPGDPAMAAAEQGDFALLKARLAVMGDKAQGWEQVLALGEQSFATLKSKAEAATKAREDAVLSAFGTDREAAAKEWANVQAWAKENAEPHEREAVNAALAAGGIAAKAMASYLKGLYSAHPSAVIEPAAVTRVGGRADQSEGALSPAAYKAEVAKLKATQGAVDGTPAYLALQARRMAWRG